VFDVLRTEGFAWGVLVGIALTNLIDYVKESK